MHEHAHSHTCTLTHACTHMYTQVYWHTFTHAISLPPSLLCSLHTDHTGLLAFLQIPAVCPPQGLLHVSPCPPILSGLFFHEFFPDLHRNIHGTLHIHTPDPSVVYVSSKHSSPPTHVCSLICHVYTLLWDNASSLGGGAGLVTPALN